MKYLDKKTSEEVFKGLSVGFKQQVQSRIQVKNNHSRFIDNPDIKQHIIGLKLQEEYHVDSVKMYDEVEYKTREILEPYISRALEIIDNETESTGPILIIMSNNSDGSKRHFKHLHTLLQGDRCNTLSVVLPLHIDSEEQETHGFWWHYQEDLYPKITYTSAERMEKVQRDYTKTELSRKHISVLKFDSARAIHYINTTANLYLWVVCDAAVFKDGKTKLEGLHVKLLDSFDKD